MAVDPPASRTLMMRMRNPLGLALVMLGPISQLFLFGSRIYDWLPVWSWYADPGYQYLLNGAVIVKGGVPGHTDHPGTSLQWMVGFIEQVAFWIGGVQDNLFEDIVYRPEQYSQIVSSTLLVFYLVALGALGYRMWKSFGLASATVTQLLLLWSIALIGSGVFKLVPETIVLLAFLVLITILVPQFRSPRSELSLLTAVLVGVVCAIGLTAKVIFLPALAIPIFLIGYRRMLTVGIAFLISVVVIMIPTIPRLPQMWTWFSGVVTNSGRHGGEFEFSTSESLANAMEGLAGNVRWFPYVSIFALILIVFLLWISRSRNKSMRDLIGILSLLTVALGIIAMGYKQTETRDFVLLAPVIGLLFGLLLFQYANLISGIGKLILQSVAVMVSLFLAAHGVVGSVYSYPLLETRSKERIGSAAVMAEISQNGYLAQAYDSWTEAGALTFAEPWTNGEFAPYIAERFPLTFEFSIWDQRIYTWNGGSSRHLVTCEEINALAAEAPFSIVVPSTGNLALNSQQTEIKSPDGTMYVSPREPIGSYAHFQITGMSCEPTIK